MSLLGAIVTVKLDNPKLVAPYGNEYVVAKYIRLSLDDGITESLSIPNQHKLLDAFIDEMEVPGIRVVEFVDNGFTGLNMERPCLQDMLEMARGGQVQCIVVKDFSRFSRNALESGYYLEQVFPLHQIRFISISDHFDSNNYKNDTGGIDIAFKLLMHEYYSQDLSRKVKSAYRIKMKRGEHIVARAIYGYYKDGQGKWEPEEQTSDVVRLIFRMALEGFPTAAIRDKLCEMRFPTPKEHMDAKWRRDKSLVKPPECKWSARSVLAILENEQYTGVYVSGKWEQKTISGGQNLVDKDKWIKFPNSHTPIVSSEDFATVQGLIKNRLTHCKTAKPVNESWKDEVLPLIGEPRLTKSKCKHPKRRRMMGGDFIAATAIYGYTKTKAGTWEVDPVAADVIRSIFEMAAGGVHPDEISTTLFESGHPMPREHQNLVKGKVFKPTCRWRAQNVRNILKNVQYTGAYVSGRTLVDGDTGKKYRPAQEDWIVIPDKHPAIITTDSYKKVQEILADGSVFRRKNRKVRDYLLRSKARCGCCGMALAYDPVTDPVLRCNYNAADSSAPCHKMKVVVRELDEAVMAVIKKQAEVILERRDLEPGTGLPRLNGMGGNVTQVAMIERKIKNHIEQRQQHYEQFVTWEIDRQTHKTLKAGCTAQIEKLSSQLALHRQAEHDGRVYQKATAQAKAVVNETATAREIVDVLVDEVIVFPDFRLEIKWKMAGFPAGV